MGNNYFKFKQFTVYQDNVTMRVNTDGALLGAWCNVEGAQRVLDVGTGTGVIALMAAQRLSTGGEGAYETDLRWNAVEPSAKPVDKENFVFPFIIDAIDIDPESCIQARRNFEQSVWKKSMNVFHRSLQDFTKESVTEQYVYARKYNLIVSNPPYFVNSLKNPSAKKTLARHADLLPYNELITCTVQLLKDNGRFSLILPSDQVQCFVEQAQRQGLFVQRSCSVFAKAEDKKPKRVLIEFIKGLSVKAVHQNSFCNMAQEKLSEVSKPAMFQDKQYRKIESITITANRSYTEEFRSLLKEFYLHF